MARNRWPQDSKRYEAQCSDEEDEASMESDSESEPERKPTVETPLPPPVVKSQPQSTSVIRQMKEQSESGSETETDLGTESGSESESETESDVPSTKPLKKSNGVANEPALNRRVSEAVTPGRSAGAKRSVEEKHAGRVSKRQKTKQPELESENLVKKSDDSKKQYFQRLWSEDDEIAMLKGMVDYAEKTKSDPVTDLNAFHSFIKDNLHVDVSRNQLQDKIRRLKKKYENNKSKEKQGKERAFSKPHEQKAYELSKHIWEGTPKANGSATIRSRKNNDVVENEERKNVDTMKHNDCVERVWSSKMLWSEDVSMEDRIYRIGSKLFEGQRRDDEEGREWKQLKLLEVELQLKMLEVKHARTKLVLDALKSTDPR
ncbi:probable transcription factor At1g11510 [Andrographis paniculata]|uniref:probable transcription factor At1g11510 n=1 Tax=Andrographis paniculata TaxID=175694 RepID=UPI0021E88E38|nr:probable transcription factor At1g11510 [Andrographis paniculata]